MIKLNQDIVGLEKLLALLEQESEQQAGIQIAHRKSSVDLQIQNLESQYRTWETNAFDASRKLSEFERMKQEMQRAQAFYERLVGLVQTVDLNKGLDQEPLVPLAPASPAQPRLSKYKMVVAALFLSLMLGAGLILTLEVMDDRFTSVTDLTLTLPGEVVGQIPESSLNGNGRIRGTRKHRQEQHAFAEAFRNLRSSLLFMCEPPRKPKVILVTSAIPEEGKTTVAANFGASLASAGSRVLLVDADLHRGTLHRVFGVAINPGLSEALSQRLPWDKAIVAVDGAKVTNHGEEAINQGQRRTKNGRPPPDDGSWTPDDGPRTTTQGQPASLFLLPAGQSLIRSSEVFLNGRLEELLHELRSQFDYIVIDSAPVLATDDVTSLGPKTDGVIMVVRASFTSARVTREALERLRRRGIEVLGLVYNRASASSDYYYRYSGGYSRSTRVINAGQPA
jgi:Mrp family chromosome partitioning ATPase